MEGLKRWMYEVVRVVLGLLWLSNALEKLIPHFPKIPHIYNATGDVIGLTRYMIQITPFPWFAAILKPALALGPILQYGVGLFELFLALTLLTNRWIRYGALLALPYLVFLELGWVNAEWAFTYPLFFALHLYVVLRTWGKDRFGIGELIIRLLSGVVWIDMGIVGHTHSALTVVAGILLFIGLLTPIASLYALVLAVGLLLSRGIEPWPWVYYALIVTQLLLLIPGFASRYGVDRLIPGLRQEIRQDRT